MGEWIWEGKREEWANQVKMSCICIETCTCLFIIIHSPLNPPLCSSSHAFALFCLILTFSSLLKTCYIFFSIYKIKEAYTIGTIIWKQTARFSRPDQVRERERERKRWFWEDRQEDASRCEKLILAMLCDAICLVQLCPLAQPQL
jgi:hypothetical protein